MNELLPIIRRKRRPLLPAEAVTEQLPTPPAETNRTAVTEPTHSSEKAEPDAEDREHDEAS